MNHRILNIDEIASIQNKFRREKEDEYIKNNPSEEICREPEPSDEESDISIILLNKKEYYQDLNGNIYEKKDDEQIGKLIKKSDDDK